MNISCNSQFTGVILPGTNAQAANASRYLPRMVRCGAFAGNCHFTPALVNWFCLQLYRLDVKHLYNKISIGAGGGLLLGSPKCAGNGDIFIQPSLV